MCAEQAPGDSKLGAVRGVRPGWVLPGGPQKQERDLGREVLPTVSGGLLCEHRAGQHVAPALRRPEPRLEPRAGVPPKVEAAAGPLPEPAEDLQGPGTVLGGDALHKDGLELWD